MAVRVLFPVSILAGIGVALALLSGRASATSDVPRFPSQLAGLWSRTVTASDVTRARAKNLPTGRDVGLGGTIVPLGPGQLNILVGIPSGTAPGSPDAWRWKVVGKSLTFVRIRDTNVDRSALFAGTWRKTGS